MAAKRLLPRRLGLPTILLVVLLAFFARSAYRSYLRSSLFEAADRGDAQAVRTLLARGADPNAVERNPESTWHGYPVLIRGILKNGDVAKALLEKGANANAADPAGQTALIYAVQCKRPELIPILVRQGADINAKVSPGDRTAVGSAASLARSTQPGYRDAYDLLRSLGARVTLFDAIASGDLKTIEALLRSGTNPNVLDFSGESPLHRAISQNQPDIVAALLSGGARVDFPNIHGETPLYTATIRGLPPPQDTTIVKMLVAKGANVNARWYGKSLLSHVRYSLRGTRMPPSRAVAVIEHHGAHE